jgi:hypothetical protein
MVAEIVTEGHRRRRHAVSVGQGCEVPAQLAYRGTSRSVVVADSADTTVPTMLGP